MKNVVLGIIGCLIVLYTAMLGLSVYNMTVRENQMEKSLSLALSGAMNRYYEPNMYIVDKKPVSSYDGPGAVYTCHHKCLKGEFHRLSLGCI